MTYKITNLTSGIVALGNVRRLRPNGEADLTSLDSYVLAQQAAGNISISPDPRVNPGAVVENGLFILRDANMAITTDQLMVKQGQFTKYICRGAFAVWKSGAFGTACAGGIYSLAAKAGDALLAATQSYANLTGTGKIVVAPVASIFSTGYETTTPFFSLTTGNTGALTADIFLMGDIID
jgi:hypothetical protein